MGLLDIFDKDKRREASIAKNVKRLKEVYGQPEGRQKAIATLRDEGSEEALAGLLMRFTVSSQPGITDQEEKEWVKEILVDFGKRSLGPIRDFLRRQTAVSWPLKAVQEIAGTAMVEEMVCDELTKLSQEYQREHTKKVTLIKHLAELGRKSERIQQTLMLFLDDEPDQDTMVAAIETLEVLDDEGGFRDRLLELFKEHAADKPRIEKLILEVFARRAWDVKGFRPTFEERIEEPFYLTSDGVVKLRGAAAS
ncbi:MAG: hypothetical protein P1V51_06520 [Deltaproteobacteria bacterium]|nr:hypothetical protein [Deltaproteobacteria bacterium]